MFRSRILKRFRSNPLLLILLTFLAICILSLATISNSNPSRRSNRDQSDLTVVVDSETPSVFCDAAVAPEMVRGFRSASDYSLNEKAILQRASQCSNYFQSFQNVLRPRLLPDGVKNVIEKNFENLNSKGGNFGNSSTPLAFSLLIHENVGIFETLLHLLFRPQHSFCVHVDTKADPLVHDAVFAIIKCFKERFPNANIFPADVPMPVFWGHISMLDAELQCLKLLEQRDSKWEFYINLAGSELPLVPVSEIEQVVSNLRPDGNAVESFPTPDPHINRYKYSYALADMELVRQESRWYLFKKSIDFFNFMGNGGYYQVAPATTGNLKRPPPFNLTIFKGQKNVILNRKFASFVLNHPVAVGFRRWSEDMLIPDEAFYSTLVRIQNIRDKTPDELEIPLYGSDNFLDALESRYIVEQDKDGESKHLIDGVCVRRSLWEYHECRGQLKREICNLAVEDLPEAINLKCSNIRTPCLFVNKVDLEVDSLSVICLAQNTMAATHSLFTC